MEAEIIVGIISMSLICGIIIGLVLATCLETLKWRKDCIKRGYAQYNKTTGQWQWKEQSK